MSSLFMFMDYNYNLLIDCHQIRMFCQRKNLSARNNKKDRRKIFGLLFHGGATGRLPKFARRKPNTKNAIIVLSNTAVSNDAVGVAILKYIDK